MAQVSLRTLATEYADGLLSKEEYRKSRAELLEGILSGTVELQVNDYPPPVVPTEEFFPNLAIDEQFEKKGSGTPPPSARTPASPPRKTDKKKLILTGVGGLLALVILIALLPADKETQTASTAPDAAVDVPPGVAQTLIQDFLDKKDWSEPSLNKFENLWQALTSEQQAGAADSVQLGQLGNSIYKKLLEERALAGLVDDEQVWMKQQKLLEFAQSIGIKDPRIPLPASPGP